MYNIEGGVDQFIPVDVYVAGCACRPEQIIDGVVVALGILEEKTKEIEKTIKLSNEPVTEDGQVNRRKMPAEYNFEKTV